MSEGRATGGQTPPSRDDPGAEARRRRLDRAGWALVALGLAGILWGVLHMNARALGGPPREYSFAHRRSYDQVKSAAHEAFPGFLMRAGGGLGLLLAGAHLRIRARRAG